MAYRNKKDTHHEKADALVRRALKGEFGKIYTSNFVYDETMTLVAVKTGKKEIARDISDVMLSPRVEMVIVDKIILEDGQKLFFKYFNRGLSFTDATTIAVMNKLEIENIITFDRHFKGIVRVVG
jgi:hypothetical protein